MLDKILKNHIEMRKNIFYRTVDNLLNILILGGSVLYFSLRAWYSF